MVSRVSRKKLVLSTLDESGLDKSEMDNSRLDNSGLEDSGLENSYLDDSGSDDSGPDDCDVDDDGLRIFHVGRWASLLMNEVYMVVTIIFLFGIYKMECNYLLPFISLLLILIVSELILFQCSLVVDSLNFVRGVPPSMNIVDVLGLLFDGCINIYFFLVVYNYYLTLQSFTGESLEQLSDVVSFRL